MTLFGGVDKQRFASDRIPMPIDNVYDTAYLNSITGEVVQLYYFNAGVLTTDAGQAAGTVVVAKLLYSGILDKLGSMIGTDEDTSLTWTTGTVLPAASIQPCPKGAFEDPENRTLESIAKSITQDFANGEWCIEHRLGLIIGKKATTGTSDTAAYKMMSTTTGGGGSVSTTVKVSDGTDVLDVLVQDAAFGTASKGIAAFGKYQATPTTYTDGDAAPILLDANGRVVLSSDIEIGSVEIKNSTTDDRVIVKAGNTFAVGDLAMGIADPNVLAAVVVPTTLTGGSKTVTASGTAEALGASLAIKSVYIRAKATNTSFVCVGDSTVDEATNQQIVLYANDSVTLDVANRATVYIDADVNSEGVDYICAG